MRTSTTSTWMNPLCYPYIPKHLIYITWRSRECVAIPNHANRIVIFIRARFRKFCLCFLSTISMILRKQVHRKFRALCFTSCPLENGKTRGLNDLWWPATASEKQMQAFKAMSLGRLTADGAEIVLIIYSLLSLPSSCFSFTILEPFPPKMKRAGHSRVCCEDVAQLLPPHHIIQQWGLIIIDGTHPWFLRTLDKVFDLTMTDLEILLLIVPCDKTYQITCNTKCRASVNTPIPFWVFSSLSSSLHLCNLSAYLQQRQHDVATGILYATSPGPTGLARLGD